MNLRFLYNKQKEMAYRPPKIVSCQLGARTIRSKSSYFALEMEITWIFSEFQTFLLHNQLVIFFFEIVLYIVFVFSPTINA